MTLMRIVFPISFLILVIFWVLGCTDDDGDSTHVDGDGNSGDPSADTGADADGDVAVACLDKKIETVTHQGRFTAGEEAPDFRAETYDGQSIVLSCLLEDGPLVLEFLRTFT